MKFTIEKRGEKWAVLSADGELLAEHDTTNDAMAFMAARMNEGAVEIAAEARGARFRIRFQEGEDSRDVGMVRCWEVGSTRFERPVVPLMLMTENPITGGHAGARLAGAIDTFSRDDTGLWDLQGNYDAGSEAGQEGERLLTEGVLTTISPDWGDMTWEEEAVEVDDDGFPTKFLMRVTDAILMGVTQTPMQAFDTATIELISEAPAEETETEQPEEEATVTPISAAGGPKQPPADWFEKPELTGPTPLTVTDDGEILGHAAIQGTCHIGVAGKCVTPPMSESAYAYFHTGAIRAAGCDCDIPVGVITMATGHADLSSDARSAAAHYDNTGAQVADVAVGEDEWGIWVHGAVRSDLSDEQLRSLKASALSGDWRPIGTGLELVALLAVNVPGFPVARTRVASGKQTALVAAGAQPLALAQEERNDPWKRWQGEIEARLSKVEVVTRNVTPLAASALRERVGS